MRDAQQKMDKRRDAVIFSIIALYAAVLVRSIDANLPATAMRYTHGLLAFAALPAFAALWLSPAHFARWRTAILTSCRLAVLMLPGFSVPGVRLEGAARLTCSRARPAPALAPAVAPLCGGGSPAAPPPLTQLVPPRMRLPPASTGRLATARNIINFMFGARITGLTLWPLFASLPLLVSLPLQLLAVYRIDRTGPCASPVSSLRAAPAPLRQLIPPLPLRLTPAPRAPAARRSCCGGIPTRSRRRRTSWRSSPGRVSAPGLFSGRLVAAGRTHQPPPAPPPGRRASAPPLPALLARSAGPCDAAFGQGDVGA